MSVHGDLGKNHDPGGSQKKPLTDQPRSKNRYRSFIRTSGTSMRRREPATADTTRVLRRPPTRQQAAAGAAADNWTGAQAGLPGGTAEALHARRAGDRQTADRGPLHPAEERDHCLRATDRRRSGPGHERRQRSRSSRQAASSAAARSRMPRYAASTRAICRSAAALPCTKAAGGRQIAYGELERGGDYDGSDTASITSPASRSLGACTARSPSEAMPTSRLSRFKTIRRRI
jgi:hypothetical protein